MRCCMHPVLSRGKSPHRTVASRVQTLRRCCLHPEPSPGIKRKQLGGEKRLLTLLHLTGVLGTQNNHLLVGEVDGNRCAGCHALRVSVCWEGTGVVNGVIGVKVLEIFPIRADKHVAHKQSVVGAGADHAHLDAVFLVPSCEPIDDVDAISRVQVVNGTFPVDSPDLVGMSVYTM